MEVKSSILIVDDNEELCDSIKDILEDDGFVVETAYSGKDAINLSQNNRYDIALVDFKLPDISGTELVNNLAGILPSMEFIYITAHATKDSAIEAVKQERIISYELKPMDMDHLLSILNQVTKRRRSEEAIQKLSQAMEFSPSVIVITDEKGRIEYANPKFVQLTGYSLEETIGKNPSILKSGYTSREIYRELWNTITSGNEWRGEFCNKKKNGERYWESASISPVKNNKGFITNFIAVKDDITDYKFSERRLKAQYEVTKVLSESNTIREASAKIIQAICTALEWDLGEIWEFDQEKNALFNSEIWHVPTLNVSEFKAVTKKITFSPKIGLPGHVFESAEPFWIADIVHDTNFPRASVAVKEGLHGAFGFPIIVGSEALGSICFYSREIRRPDKDFPNMITAIGRQIGLFIKRRQAEEMLLKFDKLKSLGAITAGVSHDFNNVLSVISGNIQLLEISNIDNKELRDVIHTIERAVNDGAEITRRMLKFTSTEKDTTGFGLHDINELIKHAVDFTKPRWKNMAQAKGRNYYIETEGIEKGYSILCNPAEIREVVVNMINNSIDAMPDGGGISFRTWSSMGKVFMRVSDNGEGMSGEARKRVFDPFFTTKGAGGTGLGMSMAYGIISRHGGKIDLESEKGKGSTFTIHFPIHTKAGSSEETTEAKLEIKSKGLRIMVVDDNEEVCNVLDKFFSSEGGHMVRTVNNGAEAIILTKIDDYDLVFCDMVMPEVYGYEVIKALNKLEKRPKIGLVTGWGESLMPMEEEEFKVDFIIKKPFNFSEIKRQINDLGI